MLIPPSSFKKESRWVGAGNLFVTTEGKKRESRSPPEPGGSVLKALDPRFFNMEKITLNSQLTKTSKVSIHKWHFLSRVPSSAKPTHSSSREGDRQQSPPGDGLPSSRCGCPQGKSDSNKQAPALRIGATLFPPGSSKKENANAATCPAHSHSHSQARKLWSSPRGPRPATLLYLSMSSPPESDLNPRWAPWLLPWRTSSPTSRCICSWKDRPKCKTNAIFQEASGGGKGGGEEQS